LSKPALNRGTAFTHAERRVLGPQGLLPSGVSTAPFPGVEHRGTTYRIAQANNALVFPGLGLGVTVARTVRVTHGMITAAAEAVAELSDATSRGRACCRRKPTCGRSPPPSPSQWSAPPRKRA
jgi:malic enzyme